MYENDSFHSDVYPLVSGMHGLILFQITFLYCANSRKKCGLHKKDNPKHVVALMAGIAILKPMFKYSPVEKNN